MLESTVLSSPLSLKGHTIVKYFEMCWTKIILFCRTNGQRICTLLRFATVGQCADTWADYIFAKKKRMLKSFRCWKVFVNMHHICKFCCSLPRYELDYFLTPVIYFVLPILWWSIYLPVFSIYLFGNRKQRSCFQYLWLFSSWKMKRKPICFLAS